jgi:hypothetical protein
MLRYEDLIEDLEQNFAVESLTYKQYSAWPLFRILLLYHRPKPNEELVEIKFIEEQKKSLKARWGDVISSINHLRTEYQRYKNHRKQLADLLVVDLEKEDHLHKAEVVFFHYQQHRNQNIKGSYSNVFLHPLQEEIENKYKCLSLEDVDFPDKAKYPRYKSSVIISPYLKWADVRRAFKKIVYNIALLFSVRKPKKVNCFSELQQLLPTQLRSSIYQSDEFLIYQMEKIIAYKNVLIEILKKIDPKILIQTSYYHPLGMALNLACEELGIKSVEMQHGILEPLAYWNFNKKVVDKFQMLPKYYWLWEADSMSTIAKWIDREDKALLGGNIWMKKMLKKMTDSIPGAEDFKKKISDYHFNILFTMQPSPFNFIPDFLIEVMRERSDILWLIRVHPRGAQEDIPAIKNLMQEKGIRNYEIDLSSSLPLPYLIQKINLHITKFSAVVFDSAMVNIPTIFLDKYADSIYSRDYPTLWNSEIINIALDSRSLSEQISLFENKKVKFKADGYFGNEDYLKSFEKILND